MATHTQLPALTPSTRAMDGEVSEEIRRLAGQGQGDEALRLLSSLRPRDREQLREWEYLASIVHHDRCEFEQGRVHAIRALRLTSGERDVRAHVRLALANTLMRLGAIEGSERQLMRGLADIEVAPDTAELRARYLNTLGRVHRQR